MNNGLAVNSGKLEIINRNFLESKVYEIRGRRVMLDFDLALIYGYSTKAFNQQIQRNIEKFDDDFMFRLSDEEVLELSRSQFVTSIQTKGVRGGRTYNPYAFTEQGIYMLMTVLKGDQATKQSKALIRLFKEMKDYITYTNNFVTKDDFIKLAIQTNKNTNDIKYIKENTITKKELSNIMDKFLDESKFKEYLILNGNMVEADIAYSEIYESAKESIYLIDNYISLKTLSLLKNSKVSEIIIFSDNVNKCLHKLEYLDFIKEYKDINIKFIRTYNKFHDRYIIIDYKKSFEKIFVCDSSSKDSGKKVTTISEIENKCVYYPLIDNLMKNKELVL